MEVFSPPPSPVCVGFPVGDNCLPPLSLPTVDVVVVPVITPPVCSEDAELEIIGPELVLSVGRTLLVTPELDGCEDGPAKPEEWAAEEVCGLEDTGVPGESVGTADDFVGVHVGEFETDECAERVWGRDGGADDRIEPLNRTDEAPDCEDVAEPGAEDFRRVVECRTEDF